MWLLWEWCLVREVGYAYEVMLPSRSCYRVRLHSKKLVAKAGGGESKILLVFGRQRIVKKGKDAAG